MICSPRCIHMAGVHDQEGQICDTRDYTQIMQKITKTIKQDEIRLKYPVDIVGCPVRSSWILLFLTSILSFKNVCFFLDLLKFHPLEPCCSKRLPNHSKRCSSATDIKQKKTVEFFGFSMKQGHFQQQKNSQKAILSWRVPWRVFSQTKNPFSYIPMPKKKHGFSTGPLLFPPLAAPAFRPWTWQHQGEPRALPRARRSPGVTSTARKMNGFGTSKSHGRFGDSNDFH